MSAMCVARVGSRRAQREIEVQPRIVNVFFPKRDDAYVVVSNIHSSYCTVTLFYKMPPSELVNSRLHEI